MNTKEEYQEFLKSEFWLKLRAEAIERDGGRCMVCNSKRRLEVHHRHYPDRWADTRLADVSTLCNRCHHTFHFPEESKPEKVVVEVKVVRVRRPKVLCKPASRAWIEKALLIQHDTVSRALVQAVMVGRGALCRDAALWIGAGWPLRKGWVKRILGNPITREKRMHLLKLAGRG